MTRFQMQSGKLAYCLINTHGIDPETVGQAMQKLLAPLRALGQELRGTVLVNARVRTRKLAGPLSFAGKLETRPIKTTRQDRRDSFADLQALTQEQQQLVARYADLPQRLARSSSFSGYEGKLGGLGIEDVATTQMLKAAATFDATANAKGEDGFHNYVRMQMHSALRDARQRARLESQVVDDAGNDPLGEAPDSRAISPVTLAMAREQGIGETTLDTSFKKKRVLKAPPLRAAAERVARIKERSALVG